MHPTPNTKNALGKSTFLPPKIVLVVKYITLVPSHALEL
jgi:hypothetical protein